MAPHGLGLLISEMSGHCKVSCKGGTGSDLGFNRITAFRVVETMCIWVGEEQGNLKSTRPVKSNQSRDGGGSDQGVLGF